MSREEEKNAGREDWRDPAGIVRRGDDAERVRYYVERSLELPPCFVGAAPGRACERGAVMEVYGLKLCVVHGEEAASAALEEMAYELEQELQRPMNPCVRSLSPHVAAAFRASVHSLAALHADYQRSDELLLEAFPLDRERTCMETLDYAEDPDASASDYMPPFDHYLQARLLVCRLMRLAYEEGADWLVETLEVKRADVAAQAAYALALEHEAGRR